VHEDLLRLRVCDLSGAARGKIWRHMMWVLFFTCWKKSHLWNLFPLYLRGIPCFVSHMGGCTFVRLIESHVSHWAAGCSFTTSELWLSAAPNSWFVRVCFQQYVGKRFFHLSLPRVFIFCFLIFCWVTRILTRSSSPCILLRNTRYIGHICKSFTWCLTHA
jgi:hypothetical protein